LEIAIEEKR